MLDEMLEGLLQEPRRIIILMIILLGVLYSFVGVLWGGVVVLLLQFKRCIAFYVFLMGFILMLVIGFVQGITPFSFYNDNQIVLSALVHGDWTFLENVYRWLVSLPVGMCLGALMVFLFSQPQGLKGELKLLSKGKQKKIQQPLPLKELQRRLQELKSAAYEGGSIIGIDKFTGEYVALSDKDANLHTLAIGTTGTGKTTALGNIIESAMKRRSPLIYVDGKGDLDLLSRVKRACEKEGIPFYWFSMVGESQRYNPIAFGGFTSKKDRMIELRTWSEDHYRKIAEGYLQTVFKVLERAGMEPDLVTLARCLEPCALYELARKQKDHDMVAMIEKIEEKRKDISSLIAEIDNIAQSEIGHLFDCSKGNGLTLKQAFDEKAVVYFCLQPLAFPAYAQTLGKLIINDIKALAASQLTKKEKIPLYAIFDEFSVFAGEQIITLLNQGRSAGVHAILSTQSLSDLMKKDNQALVGQVLNNCNNYLIQRQNYPEDAEMLANIIGTKEQFKVTSQISMKQENNVFGTVQLSKEFMVHPDEIKQLGLGNAIFVNKQTFNVKSITLRQSEM